LSEILVILGVVLTLVGGGVDLIISLHHRGNYWAAFRHRYGFYVLGAVAISLFAWVRYSLPGLIIATLITSSFALIGALLFQRKRGKLLADQRRVLRGASTALTVTGVLVTLFSLLL